MDGLVRDDVAEHGIRRENQPPVERKIPLRRAVAPLAPLPHHVDAAWLAPEARRDHREVPRDRLSRFLPEPALQASGNGGARRGSPADHDPALVVNDGAAARTRVRCLDEDLGRFPAKKDLAGPLLLGAQQAAHSLDTLERAQDPHFMPTQEGMYVLTVPRRRLKDFDAVRPDTKPQLPRSFRDHDTVVDS